MIQALIFDCDGTLTDSMPLHFLAWNQTMRRFGIEFSEDRFYALRGIPSDKIIQMLADEVNLSLDIVAVTQEREQAFRDSMHLLVEIEAITSIVRENKGKFPMAVASGGFRDVVVKQVAHIGLEGWFDTIVTAEDTTRHKPEPGRGDTARWAFSIFRMPSRLRQLHASGRLNCRASTQLEHDFSATESHRDNERAVSPEMSNGTLCD